MGAKLINYYLQINENEILLSTTIDWHKISYSHYSLLCGLPDISLLLTLCGLPSASLNTFKDVACATVLCLDLQHPKWYQGHFHTYPAHFTCESSRRIPSNKCGRSHCSQRRIGPNSWFWSREKLLFCSKINLSTRRRLDSLSHSSKSFGSHSNQKAMVFPIQTS